MKNLQEATERICELKGSLVALDALVTALLQACRLRHARTCSHLRRPTPRWPRRCC